MTDVLPLPLFYTSAVWISCPVSVENRKGRWQVNLPDLLSRVLYNHRRLQDQGIVHHFVYQASNLNTHTVCEGSGSGTPYG